MNKIIQKIIIISTKKSFIRTVINDLRKLRVHSEIKIIKIIKIKIKIITIKIRIITIKIPTTEARIIIISQNHRNTGGILKGTILLLLLLLF